jgi:outer membrane lipoprotein SlyB
LLKYYSHAIVALYLITKDLKMKNNKTLPSILILNLVLLCGCATNSQNNYSASDVGHPTQVVFGTIVQAREINITEKNTGTGAAVGVGGGALAGAAIGRSVGGLLVGALVGGIGGAIAENAADNHGGYEYTVTLETGKTITVAQNKGDDIMLAPGTRCMVQFGNNYSRVLPANQLPSTIAKPKSIKLKPETPAEAKATSDNE